MGDPNDNEANHQTDGRDPLQGGPLSRGRAEPPPKAGARVPREGEAKDGDRTGSGTQDDVSS